MRESENFYTGVFKNKARCEQGKKGADCLTGAYKDVREQRQT